MITVLEEHSDMVRRTVWSKQCQIYVHIPIEATFSDLH